MEWGCSGAPDTSAVSAGEPEIPAPPSVLPLQRPVLCCHHSPVPCRRTSMPNGTWTLQSTPVPASVMWQTHGWARWTQVCCSAAS